MKFYRKTKDFISNVFSKQKVPISKQAAAHNHLILRKVAKYLPLSDLKKLRFVSRQWNSNFSEAFFQSSSVEIKSLESLALYTQEMDPFIHSQFNIRLKSNPDKMAVMTFQDFFVKYGTQILKLKLRIRLTRTTGTENLQPLLAVLRRLKNVRNLSLDLNFWGELHPQQQIPVLKFLQEICLDIFNHEDSIKLGSQEMDRVATSLAKLISTMAPNLQWLTVWDIFTRSSDLRQIFCTKLAEHFALSPPALLNTLYLYGNGEIIKPLRHLPISLKILKIYCDELNLNMDAYDHLYELLQTQAESLEELVVVVKPVADNGNYTIPLRFPKRFPKLTRLMLQFGLEDDGEAFQEDVKVDFPMSPIMDYSETFPSLKSLLVLLSNCEYQSKYQRVVLGVMFPSGGVPCRTVGCLRVQLPPTLWSMIKFVFRIKRTFPHLKSLLTSSSIS